MELNYHPDLLPGTSEGAYSGRTVILADGSFPTAPYPLAALESAGRIVCCDGAADKLLAYGREPDLIVGDLDSLSDDLRHRYAGRLRHNASQENNDLTKAFNCCLAQGWLNLVILGATGKREDHALGNLSLLADYAAKSPAIALLTDHGCFLPLLTAKRIATRPGQQISLFSFDPATEIDAAALKWPLKQLRLTRWWQATLNQALGSEVEINFRGGPLLVYLTY